MGKTIAGVLGMPTGPSAQQRELLDQQRAALAKQEQEAAAERARLQTAQDRRSDLAGRLVRARAGLANNEVGILSDGVPLQQRLGG